jgi:hypothetical protein
LEFLEVLETKEYWMKSMDRLSGMTALRFCTAASVSGQVWTGAVNQNWFTALNWIPSSAPTASSTAYILTSPAANMSSNGATAYIFSLGTEGTLNVNIAC